MNINGDTATIDYTLVLDASAYGAKGVYRMSGAHKLIKINNMWYYTN